MQYEIKYAKSHPFYVKSDTYKDLIKNATDVTKNKTKELLCSEKVLYMAPAPGSDKIQAKTRTYLA